MKDNPFKIQEGSIRDSAAREFIRDRKSGDYVSFSAMHGQRLGKFFEERRITLLMGIFFIVIFALFSRSFYLQVIRANDFRDIAEGNRIHSEVIPATRGLIYDRFGEPLVKNISYFFLYLTPELLPSNKEESRELITSIAETLELENVDELTKIIETSRGKNEKVLVYEDLEHADAIKFMALANDNPAITVSYESRRQYFSSLGMAHSLGYLGSVSPEDLESSEGYYYIDRIGKNGLERQYETILRGRPGVKQSEVDALFRLKNIISITEPIDGRDISLTIDFKAQEKLFEIMSANARNFGKPKMAAIVMDPKDGGILAMTSLPSYDSNIFTTVLNAEDYAQIINNPDTPLLNRAISGTYPLGSIFKTVVGSAALEEGIISRNFTIKSTGGVSVGGSFFPDWRSSGHGVTDIRWALADSVNTFFYSIGGGNNQWLSLGLGADRIIGYAKKFGLGSKSSIDIGSEADGFLPTKAWKQENLGERWFLGDTYNLSIGQGYLLATPLQTASLMSYFANNGTSYSPHFLQSIDSDGSPRDYQPAVALTNVISTDNLNTIRQGLRDTVRVGTAQSMQSIAVPVAGKTGTAQFNRNKTPHSWFAGFAPYNDAKIVIAVIVEEGGDRGVAVTVARQFMEWYFSQ